MTPRPAAPRPRAGLAAVLASLPIALASCGGGPAADAAFVPTVQFAPTATTAPAADPAPAATRPAASPTRSPTQAPIVPTATPALADACPGAPVIPSFVIDPDAVTLGESATLRWGTAANADRVEIDNGVGQVATPGTAEVTPARTTTFRITATGCGGQSSLEATLRVGAFRPNQGFPGDVTEEDALRNPRALQLPLAWRADTFHNPQNDNLPGGPVYEIEIDGRGEEYADWHPVARADFPFTGQDFSLAELPKGMNLLRFRSRARSADGSIAPSAFSDYTFLFFQ
jgi:hypothetical protein